MTFMRCARVVLQLRGLIDFMRYAGKQLFHDGVWAIAIPTSWNPWNPICRPNLHSKTSVWTLYTCATVFSYVSYFAKVWVLCSPACYVPWDISANSNLVVQSVKSCSHSCRSDATFLRLDFATSDILRIRRVFEEHSCRKALRTIFLRVCRDFSLRDFCCLPLWPAHAIYQRPRPRCPSLHSFSGAWVHLAKQNFRFIRAFPRRSSG